MICPYRNGKFTERQMVKRVYNQDQIENYTMVVTTQEYETKQCLRLECAVWVNGKCEYRGN